MLTCLIAGGGGRFVLFSFVGHADVKMSKKFGDNVAKTLGL